MRPSFFPSLRQLISRAGTRKPYRRAKPTYFRPAVELLEDRVTPTGLQITSLAALVNMGAAPTVSIDGTLTDDDPASVNVTIADSAMGSTFAAADGTFHLQAPLAGAGLLAVNAMNGQGQFSAPASLDLSSVTLTNPGAKTNITGDTVNLALWGSAVNNDPLTFSAVGLPAGLSIVTGVTGTAISGTLPSGAASTTPYSVTVTAADALAGISIAQSFQWSVTGPPPIPMSDSYAMLHDRAFTGGSVLANDWSVNNEPMTATVLTGPTHGNLVLNSDGTFTYTPAAGFVGQDQFTYTASTATNGATATATLYVTNHVPSVLDSVYEISATQPTAIDAAGGVLVLATDPEDAVTAVLLQGPQQGALTLAADGSFVYTPGPNYAGLDSFTFAAFDGAGQSAPATVTLTSGLLAVKDEYYVSHDQKLVVGADGGVLANDVTNGQTGVTVAVVTAPQNGVVVLNADGSLSYQPNVNYVGVDSFQYQITAGAVTSNVATVAINVRNNAPVAGGNNYYGQMDQPLVVTASVGVLTNAYDPDGDTVYAQLVQGGQFGAIAFNADGGFTYTPNPGFIGPDGFWFRPFDANVLAFGLPAFIGIQIGNLGGQIAGQVAGQIGGQIANMLLPGPNDPAITISGKIEYGRNENAGSHAADDNGVLVKRPVRGAQVDLVLTLPPPGVILQNINNVINNGLNQGGNLLNFVAAGLAPMIPGAPAVAGLVNNVIANPQGFGLGLVNGAINILPVAVGPIGGAILNPPPGLGGMVNNLVGMLPNPVAVANGIVGGAQNVAANVVPQPIQNFAGNAGQNIGNFFGNVQGFVNNNVVQPAQNFVNNQALPFINQNVVQPFNDNVAQPVQQFVNNLPPLQQFVDNLMPRVTVIRVFTDDQGRYSFRIRPNIVPADCLAVVVSAISAPTDGVLVRHAVQVGDIGLAVPGWGLIPNLGNALNLLPAAMVAPEFAEWWLANATPMSFDPFSIKTAVAGNNNADVNQDVFIGQANIVEKAFWTFDAGITMIRGHSTLADAPVTTARIAMVTIPLGTSMCPPVLNMPLIKATDFDSFDTVGHEYGHFIQHTSGAFPFVPAQYATFLAGDPFGAPANHTLGQNLTVRYQDRWRFNVNELAFSEGWGNFFSVSAQQPGVDATCPSEALGTWVNSGGSKSGDKFLDIVDMENEQLNIGNRGRNFGEDDENTVMRVLWDLSDQENEPLDRISMGLNGVFSEIIPFVPPNPVPPNQAGPGALPLPASLTLDMLNRRMMFERPAMPDKINVGAIFQLNNVSPRLDGTSIGGNVALNAAAPQIQWEVPKGENNPLTAQMLNEFRIVIFNADYTQVLFDSGILDLQSNDPAQVPVLLQGGNGAVVARLGWTPGANWANVVQGAGVKHAVMLGALRTNDFLFLRTGEYMGDEFEFTVG